MTTAARDGFSDIIAIMRSLLVLALLASSASADSTKYKESQAQGSTPMRRYKRAAAGAVPTFSEARVAKFLGAAVWNPGPPGQDTAPKLRFVDPAKPRPKAKRGELVIPIGRIAKRDRMILVEVNSTVYALAPCADRKAFACLSPAGVPIDPPNESDQERAKREELEALVRQQPALKK